MNKNFTIIVLSWLACLTASVAKPVKVVCFGDSITKGGYPAIVGETLGVEIVNSGVGGHSSSQAMRRFQKDVLDHKPDIVVVFFGTNDLRVDSERVHTPVDKYVKNLKEIITRCRKLGSKVVLCTPPPIDAKIYHTRHDKATYDKHGGLETLLKSYADAARTTAKDEKTALVDLNQLLLNEPTWMRKDGVHPSHAGKSIIAKYVSDAIKPLLPTK